jgi:cytochrome b561
MTTESERYSLTHRVLHWTMAAAILIAIPGGVIMGRLPPGAMQNNVYDLHKSLGVLVLVLAIARILIKRRDGVPAPASGMEPWQVKASTSVHHALYALMVVVPLLGFVANSFYGAAIPFFWLFTIPTFTPHNEEIAGAIFSLHTALAILFGLLLVVHIGAALHHRYVRKDAVFSRMSLP